MLLRAALLQREIMPKMQNRNSPAHTSREMQTKLLDIMSKSKDSRGGRKLLDTMSKSPKKNRRVAILRRAGTVFRAVQRKQPDRKQSPEKKSVGSQGSSKRRMISLRKMRIRGAAVRRAGRRAALQRKKTLLRRTAAGSRPGKQKILKTITVAGIPTTRAKKRADTAGGSIRTGSARKNLILNVTSRRTMPPLQKMMPLLMAQSRSFRAARN